MVDNNTAVTLNNALHRIMNDTALAGALTDQDPGFVIEVESARILLLMELAQQTHADDAEQLRHWRVLQAAAVRNVERAKTLRELREKDPARVHREVAYETDFLDASGGYAGKQEAVSAFRLRRMENIYPITAARSIQWSRGVRLVSGLGTIPVAEVGGLIAQLARDLGYLAADAYKVPAATQEEK